MFQQFVHVPARLDIGQALLGSKRTWDLGAGSKQLHDSC